MLQVAIEDDIIAIADYHDADIGLADLGKLPDAQHRIIDAAQVDDQQPRRYFLR